MQFIAIRSFRNNIEAEIKDPVHPHHIHKGALLDLGNGKTFADVQKADKKAAQLIGQLMGARCIADASDKKIVAQIEEELELEEAQAEEAAKTSRAAGSNADLVKQLSEALKALLPAKAEKPA